jgi:mannose-6-phosphate isomerase-like protein (cupin superfamily)
MTMDLFVADIHAPSNVYRVHGGEGVAGWKCLARRAGLHGSWEAVEWATIPPHGVCGEHVHTRTEEVYFMVSGHGEVILNGHPREVGAGDVVLTGLGTRHGLRSLDDEPVGWLVIELLSPTVAAVLRGAPAATRDEGVMSGSLVANLREAREIKPTNVLTGPLQVVRLVTLQRGEGVRVTSQGVEHALFILSGSGEGVAGTTRQRLLPGTAVTLPLDTDLSISAGDDGLEYFQATLAVYGDGAS